MVTKKTRLLFIIGATGSAITTLSVTDSHQSSKMVGSAVGAIVTAAVAATIVTLFTGHSLSVSSVSV